MDFWSICSRPKGRVLSFLLALSHIIPLSLCMMEKTQECRPLQNQTDVDVLHSGIEIKGATSEVEPRDAYDGDEDQLARLGKKQVLRVRD